MLMNKLSMRGCSVSLHASDAPLDCPAGSGTNDIHVSGRLATSWKGVFWFPGADAVSAIHSPAPTAVTEPS
jgi:hypothetical protein